jgi:hypothetical protein
VVADAQRQALDVRRLFQAAHRWAQESTPTNQGSHEVNNVTKVCPREVWVVFDENGFVFACTYVEQYLSKLPGKTQQRYVIAAPAEAAQGEDHDWMVPGLSLRERCQRLERALSDAKREIAMLRALAPKAAP